MRRAPSVFAQTNVALFNQLRAAGYRGQDLHRLCRGYELARALFTQTVRSSQKPFLAHLTGTASVLVWLGARPPVVAAGLLHAAYGLARVEPTRLTRAIGKEAAQLVARYTMMPWDERSVPLLERTATRLPRHYRDVVLMRLANELEDHADLGVLYGPDAAQKTEWIRGYLYRTIPMAKALGYPALAEALQHAFRKTLATRLPRALRFS